MQPWLSPRVGEQTQGRPRSRGITRPARNTVKKGREYGLGCSWKTLAVRGESPFRRVYFSLIKYLFPELGYVSLEEFESIHYPFLPIPLIVRDEHFDSEYLMSVYVEAALRHQRITENLVHLQQAHQKLRQSLKVQ